MTLQDTQETGAQTSAQPTPAPSEESRPLWIEPDLEFIRALGRQGCASFKQCMQCGVCSGTCSISPDLPAFPCKEMSWAAWGMKEKLLKDPDVWLCYQCSDCSARCPRGARPGDVLGAVRQQCVMHYAFPRFLGAWVNQPQCIPLLLGIAAALLWAALLLKAPIENAMGITTGIEKGIVISYSNMFPHWLLNSFFGLFSLLALGAVIVGVTRFWRALNENDARSGVAAPAQGLPAGIAAVLKSVFTHDKFGVCEKARSRFWSHTCVFYGFLALCAVTLWIITAGVNPIVQGDFIYPFSFWNPWKMLANAGGVALFAGCVLMMWDRLKEGGQIGPGIYFDWALITTLFVVVLTGFITEALHYVRLEPHRHISYFIHLMFVFALLMYLPYSKLAHIFYRTAALVYAEHTGRDRSAAAVERTSEER